jgi:hypothetical protein
MKMLVFEWLVLVPIKRIIKEGETVSFCLVNYDRHFEF